MSLNHLDSLGTSINEGKGKIDEENVYVGANGSVDLVHVFKPSR